MKAFILFSVLYCLANFSYAQEQSSETKPEFARIKIGLNATPEMGYRIIMVNGSSSASLRNQTEEPKMGFSAGLTVIYNFSKKIGLETGLQYASRGYIYKTDDFFSDPFLLMPETIESKYSWNYLEIPVRAVFTSGEKKVKFLASAGATAGFFLNARSTTIIKYLNGQESITSGELSIHYRQFVISPQLSLGAEYQLSPLIHFRFEPIARFALNSLVDSRIKTNLISGGLMVSFYVVL
jgi:hypothetical protein